MKLFFFLSVYATCNTVLVLHCMQIISLECGAELKLVNKTTKMQAVSKALKTCNLPELCRHPLGVKNN